MIKKIIAPILFTISLNLYSQSITTILKADGPGDTYKLIDSVFNPEKGSAIESPGIKTGECDNHSNYQNKEGNSNHITEVIDPEMGPVFQFTLHAKEDKDRYKCENKDRQRNEIKTYQSSPDYLKATIDEKVAYQWTMKLPKDFQVSNSFTHLHQIKSVGGIKNEEKIPLITFTAYKKDKGDQLNIRYSETTSQETIAKLPLDELKGQWIEFTETITFKKGKGEYQLIIKNIKTGKTILDYSNKMVTYKKNASFMRPKWGIYRSLNYPKDIKDENILFSEFKIIELISENP